MGVDEPAGPILLDGAKSISSPHKSKLHGHTDLTGLPGSDGGASDTKEVLTIVSPRMNPRINESNHTQGPDRTPEIVKTT